MDYDRTCVNFSPRVCGGSWDTKSTKDGYNCVNFFVSVCVGSWDTQNTESGFAVKYPQNS